MDIDRLLSIHQSHSLMKIGAINKQMLIAQYAQCEQISALQKQISASNNISRQILENQLKEIKHQELLRYYKSLAYAMKEAARRIEAEKDMMFKCFLYELYSEPIINNTREAKSNLEEISDKEYCNGIEATMQAIYDTCSLCKNEYDKSDFSRLLKSQSSYQEQQNEFAEKHRTSLVRRAEIEKELSAIKPKPMKNANRGCGSPVRWFHASSESSESDWICKKIEEFKRNGCSYDDMAVLYRSNYSSRYIEQAFMKHKIP